MRFWNRYRILPSKGATNNWDNPFQSVFIEFKKSMFNTYPVQKLVYNAAKVTLSLGQKLKPWCNIILSKLQTTPTQA